MADPEEMYQCQTSNCGYIYNPDKGCKKRGVEKGVCWDDLGNEFQCPVCGATKKMFRPVAGPGSVREEGA
jgi:rubredoxin